jgi:hypothetical protein
MAQWTGDRLDLSFEHVDELDIRIIAGEANVTTGEGPARVEVEVFRGPPAEVRIEGGKLSVLHQPERSVLGIMGGLKAIVSVVVPEETRASVRTVSADAFVAGLRAPTTVTTVSGAITATGLDGDITLRSVSGDVEAQGLAGTLRADSVSGDVTATADVSSARAKTVSGDVTLDLESTSEVDCVSVSGAVAVRLPTGAGIDVEVATISGRLDTNFPDGDLEITRRRMRGRIGGGGLRTVVRTTSGDVAILRGTQTVAPDDAGTGTHAGSSSL